MQQVKGCLYLAKGWVVVEVRANLRDESHDPGTLEG